MRIAGIGGGTGLPVFLSGLKELSDAGEPLDITAIVTVADNGGSTGALRDAFGMPAMGDIRKCMIALAAEESILTSVCRHRFAHPENFAGHSLGNLILSALYQISGNFTGAVEQVCEILHLKGRVLPSTGFPVTLCALYEDGGIARGETNIPQPGRRIRRVWLEGRGKMGSDPSRETGLINRDGHSLRERGQTPFSVPMSPSPAPGVVEALENADAIVIGPGSLYTSIIPNLLVAGIPEAIRRSHGVRIYIGNLMTQPGETDGYSAADHLRTLLEHVSPIDLCVVNSSLVGMAVARRYVKSGSRLVSVTADDQDEICSLGVTPAAAPLLMAGPKARHDAGALARLVVSLARGFGGGRNRMESTEQEVTCAE